MSLISIAKKSWHYRFNEWCHNRLGKENPNRFRTLCSYFWFTVQNAIFTVFVPLFWLLGTPLFDNKMSVGSEIKRDCLKGSHPSGFKTIDRAKSIGFGLLVFFFVGFLFIFLIGIPAVFLSILFLTGNCPEDLQNVATTGMIVLAIMIFIFFEISWNTAHKIWKAIKGRYCPLIEFKD